MKIHFGFAAFFLVLGCSSKSSSSDGGSSSVLAGTWSTPCTPEGDLASKTVIVILGSSYKETKTDYSASNCAAGSEDSALRTEASLSIGSAASAPEGATKLDLTGLRFFMTPKSDSAVSRYNTEANYGFTDWVKNREREITDVVVDDASGAQRKIYTIFKITGNTVCFGASDGESDGSADAKRKSLLETGNGCLTR
ncbi:MAG: hypothetical protein FJY29_01840 [Betaproteobacteria bacterium]|nr:hypothetical protein [Betaproteobacteria bacterium]